MARRYARIVRRFATPRWLVQHAVMVILVAAFLALGGWQVGRAVAGNTLSYAYAVEWPIFALFVIGVWVREIRQELRPAKPAPPAGPVRAPLVVPVPSADPPDDPALSAYNDYLAWLAADPDRRPGDYRPDQ